MDKFLSALPFLAQYCADDVNDAAACGVLTAVYYVRFVVKVLQIIIPIALILWGTIDMGKAVIAGDEKKMKEAQKPFIKRIISAVIVFLIPFIVTLVINIIPDSNQEFKSCWNSAASKPGCMSEFNSGLE